MSRLILDLYIKLLNGGPPLSNREVELSSTFPIFLTFAALWQSFLYSKLKNTCFEELNVLTNKINKLNKDYFYLNKTYDNDIDYYKRYISKLKLIIEEKDVDYWNINKCSSFVGFKLLK